jgi:hypothetical protein
MTFSSSSTSWIYAYKSGSSLNTDSQSASITQHAQNGYGTFEFDSTAQGGTDSNPFLTSSDSTTNTTSSSDTTSSTISASSSGSNRNRLITIHAALACVAFVIVFPFGGIMIRALSFPGLLWAHGILQILGYLMYIGAVGLGVYIAKNPNSVSSFSP